MWRRTTLTLACLVLAAAATATAQPEQGGRILLASVVNAQGRSIVDLEADDFLVTEGGREREVVDVHIADYPVVLLLDAGVEASFWPAIKTAAARFITRIGERPVTIGSLSTGDTLVSSFEDERSAVLERLESLPQGPEGRAQTLPAVAAAARLLHDTTAPFSAIVVITARAIDANQVVQGDLLPVILESGATVHVIENRPGVTGGGAGTDPPDLLKILADQTHGQYTLIFASASYSIAMDRLADRLAGEMMIQYVVPAGAAPADVKVGVRRPGARVVGLGVSK
jgi:hypothetical protein